MPILERLDRVLTPQECGRIVSGMRSAPRTEGLVLRGGIEILDHDTRACGVHDMPQAVCDFVLARIRPLQRKILDLFDLPPCVINGPYFFSYGPGDCFKLHKDTAGHASDPQCVADRLLTLVLYLNGREATAETPAFDGGGLMVYDSSRPGLSGGRLVIPEAGTLVAFRSDCWHEVMTIHEGERYAALCWFLKPQEIGEE
jgi:predicted 2-oxoglutarate/Fe(II)-dependent dioxygenase YbiX